jgi:hypothetical protein
VRIDLTEHIERFTVSRLLFAVIVWVVGFACIYVIIPRFLSGSGLTDTAGTPVGDFGNALFFSTATATTLGDNLLVARGWLRAFSAIEVIGGIVMAGLLINAIIGLPSQQLRRAVRACCGWWIERVTFPGRPPLLRILSNST